MEIKNYGIQTLYTYDSNCNLTYREGQYSTGTIREYAEYTYDKKGNVLTQTGEDGSDDYERTLTYDSNGNLYQES